MAEEAPGAAGGGNGAAAGATLGFALAAKPKRAKVSVQLAEKQEERVLITGMEGSRIKTAAPEAGPAGPRVIAAIGNTYRAGVGRAGPGGGGGFVPSFKPPAAEDALATSNEEKFVAAPADDGTKPAVAKYGLQRMGGQKAAGPDAAEQQQPEEGDPQDRGLGQDTEQQQQQQQQRGGAEQPARPAYAARGRGNDKQQLMEELGELPDEMETEAYEATPVDEFAKALLRGMGWREGEGVGRSKQTVEVKQIVPRPDRLGLGADPAALPQRPKVVKMGDKPKQDLVAAPTADGRARHRVGLDEKLVPREETLPGPRPGKAMRVVAGRHAGFACVVKEVLPKVEGRSDRALVELLPSHERVAVRVSELGEPGAAAAAAAAAAQRPSSRGGSDGGSREREAGRGSERERERERERGGSGSGRDREREREPDGSRGRGHSSRERERGGGSKRDRSRDQGGGRDGGGGGGSKRHRDDRGRAQRGRHGSESSSGSDDGSPPPPAKPTWLFPNIRVRLLSKRLGGGALYLKKGVVVDVHPGAVADVAVEETRRVVQLPEAELETVVPKDAGRPVQVVAGRWRGRRGRLLQASRSGGVAAVQLAGDMEVVRLSLDDVAEYMGSLDEEGDDG